MDLARPVVDAQGARSSTLTILPTVVLFLLAQKHIVAGLTAGAVKG